MKTVVRRAGVLLLTLTSPLPVLAQNQPPSPVKYTEAQERSVRRTIQLPG